MQGGFGWQDYVATDGKGFVGLRKLPPGVAPNLALSLFGITGTTAYFGINEIGQIKAGETVVVSGAAGSTGSIAGQIAKIKGCRVIGTAGGKEKCDWLVKTAHFDAAIDYKSEDIGARLSELCPNGIDVFFDNVGGTVLNEVLARINLQGAHRALRRDLALQRSHPAARAGELFQSHGKTRPHGRIHHPRLCLAYSRGGRGSRPLAARRQLAQKEDVAVGLENAPRTLMRLFTGENFGKQLLKIADPR